LKKDKNEVVLDENKQREIELEDGISQKNSSFIEDKAN
jgi:hypothetical protein